MAKNKKASNKAGPSDKAPEATGAAEPSGSTEQPDAPPAAAATAGLAAAASSDSMPGDWDNGSVTTTTTTTEQQGGAQQEEVAALRQQLTEAVAEIEGLKALLAKRDAEITSLKQAAAGAAPATNLPPPSEDIQNLQERLQRLKKEQAEADSAREGAWRQLKAVVAEISRLAGPEAKAQAAAQAAV